MNWPVQSHAAEMLRWTCGLASDRGIALDGAMHDAILAEGPIEAARDLESSADRAMGDASAIVLDGPRLSTDAKIIRWPNRFRDKDGWETWRRITNVIGPIRTTR
jgi:hypothetical protein